VARSSPATKASIVPCRHVHYWDYIGWKDLYADPRNTQRQQAFAS
jgi:hypothetical protein